MRNVLRLVVGFVLRLRLQTALMLSVVVVPLVVIDAQFGRENFVVPWFADILRTLLAAAPLTGAFFGSPEVLTVPASRRERWTAQWLLAAFGTAVLLAAIQAVGPLVQGRLSGHELLQIVLYQFVGSTLCAASVAIVFAPRATPRRGSLQAAVIIGAFCLWAGSACLSWAIGRVIGDAIASPVALALWVFALGLFVAELLIPPLTPGVHISYGQDGAADHQQSSVNKVNRNVPRERQRRPTRGVERWALRRLVWATIAGVGVVLFSALANSWMPEDPGLTFVQRMAGSYVSGIDSRFLTTMVAFFWAEYFVSSLRMLRSVPIARWVLTATLSGGIAVLVAVVVALELVWYRVGFGFWPTSFEIPLTLGLICGAALAKTAYLAVGPARPAFFIVVAANVFVAPKLTGIWAGMSGTSVVGLTVLVLVLLASVDFVLLTARSGLYRNHPLPSFFGVGPARASN